MCAGATLGLSQGNAHSNKCFFSIPIASVMFHSTSLHLSSPRLNFLLHSTQPNSLPLNFTHFTPTSPHLSSHFHSPTPCSTPLNPTHFHSTSLTSPQPHIIRCFFVLCGHDMVWTRHGVFVMYWCFVFVWTTWCVVYVLVSLLFVYTRHFFVCVNTTLCGKVKSIFMYLCISACLVLVVRLLAFGQWEGHTLPWTKLASATC